MSFAVGQSGPLLFCSGVGGRDFVWEEKILNKRRTCASCFSSASQWCRRPDTFCEGTGTSMKKLLALLMALSLVVFTGCSGDKSSKKDDKKADDKKTDNKKADDKKTDNKKNDGKKTDDKKADDKKADDKKTDDKKTDDKKTDDKKTDKKTDDKK